MTCTTCVSDKAIDHRPNKELTGRRREEGGEPGETEVGGMERGEGKTRQKSCGNERLMMRMQQ